MNHEFKQDASTRRGFRRAASWLGCLIACALCGCDRSSPPEVAAFRPPASRAVDEVPEPKLAADTTPSPAPKQPADPRPTTKPAATAPVAQAPPPEPTPEPEAPREPTIIGTWRVTDISRNGESMPLGGMEMTFIFAEDGTLTQSASGGPMPEAQTNSGTYTLNDNSLTLEMQGQSQSGTVTFEGTNGMIFEMDQGRMTLTRA